MTEAISGCEGLFEEDEFENGVESRSSEGTESLGSGDGRKGEESCSGCGGGGGVSEKVGAWGSMIGEVIKRVDVGRLEDLMLVFFFLLSSLCNGRPALLVRWPIESTIGWI